MKLVNIIVLLVTLVLVFTFIDVIKTGNVSNLDVLWGDVPEWEKYYLDEDANKGKYYCRVTEDEREIVVETRWYNYFINTDELVRTDEGDTRIENCENPDFKPVYLGGSNKDKIYSRTVRRNGAVVETKWYNACTGKLGQTDEGDTTFSGSDGFEGKCYHSSVAINGNVVLSSDEFDLKDNPLYEIGNNIFNMVRNLLNV